MAKMPFSVSSSRRSCLRISPDNRYDDRLWRRSGKTRLVASGNGLANPIWRQIVADVLARPMLQGTDEQASERAEVGAAMVAGIGAGVFDGYQDARKLAPVFDVVTETQPLSTNLITEASWKFIPD
jgi:sugar (pentulose or hexulose) kinase